MPERGGRAGAPLSCEWLCARPQEGGRRAKGVHESGSHHCRIRFQRGAGIQADLKTIAAHHLFGESVVTALTAQNTLGVTGVLEVDPVFVGTQIDAVFDDIRPDAVKIGMVSSPVIVGAIADGLDRHKAANVVVDP